MPITKFKGTVHHGLDKINKTVVNNDVLELIEPSCSNNGIIDGHSQNRINKQPSKVKYDADSKRVSAFNNRLSEIEKQNEIVRNSLLGLGTTPKRIKFNDDGNNDVITEVNADDRDENNHSTNNGTKMLFPDQDDDINDVTDAFQPRNFMNDEEGEKLWRLESNYAGDDRFRLSEKFLDGQSKKSNISTEKAEMYEEKKRETNILQRVLGYSVALKSNKLDKGDKKESDTFDLEDRRFDPTRMEPVAEDDEVIAEEKEEEDVEQSPLPKSEMLDRGFRMEKYLFDELKSHTNDDVEQTAGFSVLSALGIKRKVIDADDTSSPIDANGSVNSKQTGRVKSWQLSLLGHADDGGDNSSEDEDVGQLEADNEDSKHENKIKKPSFFFRSVDDPRLKEAVDKFRRRQSIEAVTNYWQKARLVVLKRQKSNLKELRKKKMTQNRR